MKFGLVNVSRPRFANDLLLFIVLFAKNLFNTEINMTLVAFFIAALFFAVPRAHASAASPHITTSGGDLHLRVEVGSLA